MATSRELKRMRNSYIEYRSNVVSTKESLELPATTLEKIKCGLSAAYLVDDTTGDEKYLVKLEKKISDVKNNLDVILNKFDEEIAEINNEIRRAEYREAQERKKALQEAMSQQNNI